MVEKSDRTFSLTLLALVAIIAGCLIIGTIGSITGMQALVQSQQLQIRQSQLQQQIISAPSTPGIALSHCIRGCVGFGKHRDGDIIILQEKAMIDNREINRVLVDMSPHGKVVLSGAVKEKEAFAVEDSILVYEGYNAATKELTLRDTETNRLQQIAMVETAEKVDYMDTSHNLLTQFDAIWRMGGHDWTALNGKKLYLTKNKELLIADELKQAPMLQQFDLVGKELRLKREVITGKGQLHLLPLIDKVGQRIIYDPLARAAMQGTFVNGGLQNQKAINEVVQVYELGRNQVLAQYNRVAQEDQLVVKPHADVECIMRCVSEFKARQGKEKRVHATKEECLREAQICDAFMVEGPLKQIVVYEEAMQVEEIARR